MRIMIATPLYPPDIGGPASYTKLLEEELPKHDIDVTVVSFGSVRRLPVFISHFVYLVTLLVKARGVDIIYALDPWSVGIPSLVAAKILRKRFILRIAGDYAWEQGTQRYNINESLDTFSKQSSSYPIFVRLLKRGQYMAAKYAEQVIVPSNYLKKIITNWGISKEKITVIYNSFILPKNLASKEVLRELMQIRGRIIVSAGRLVPWKGFKTLIHIMPVLVKSFPDLKLLIIGDGPEEERLEKFIIDRNVGDHVVLVGRLDKETLMRYITSADIFVLNTFYEGFSHQLLEAMALGIPIVTTKAGGNPELLEHNKHGLLVTYDDKKALTGAISRLLKDKKTRQTLAQNAQRKAQTFTQKKAITKLLKAIST